MEPYVTFEMELDTKQRVVVLMQQRVGLIQILVDALGVAGGLSTPISAVACILVAYLAEPGFVRTMSRGLFLMTTFKEKPKAN